MNKKELDASKLQMDLNNLSIAANEDTKSRCNKSFNHFRYITMVMSGVALGSMYFCRLAMTVALVSMVNHTKLHLEAIETASLSLENLLNDTNDYNQENQNFPNINEPPVHNEFGEFAWGHEIQQTILSSYMFLYTIPQLYTTQLAIKAGPRLSVFIGLVVCAVTSGLTPIISYCSWHWVVALRCLHGLGASHMISILLYIIEIWIPVDESTRMLIILQFIAGIMADSAPLVSGLLSNIHWKWAFYVPGAVTLVIAVIWYLIIRDDLLSSPFLSQKEHDYIEAAQMQTNLENEASGIIKQNYKWYDILKTKHFYYFALCWICYETFANGFFSFLVPDYLQAALHISVSENGIFNFLIQLGGITSMLYPQLAIVGLQKLFGLSLSNSRKATYLFCNILAIIPFVYIAQYHDSQVLAFAACRAFQNANDLLVTVVLLSAYGPSGMSSVAFSMMNTVGCLSIAFFCKACGFYLDTYNGSLSAWSNVFMFGVGEEILGMILFLFFMHSEPIKLKGRPITTKQRLPRQMSMAQKHQDSRKSSMVASIRQHRDLERQGSTRSTSLSRQLSMHSAALMVYTMSNDFKKQNPELID